MELGAQAAGLGYRVNWVERCGSTNDLAKQALVEGCDRLWIVAGEQLDGRGRLGRVWTSKSGNLYATLALVEPAPIADAPQIGFVAALAVHDAGTAVCRGGGFGLKWPNDLLLERRKVAGILIEGAQTGTGRFGVVIGFGVNVADHPLETRYGATHLGAHCAGVNAAGTFTALSDAMAARLAQWRNEGFGAVRDAWLARACGLGEIVRVSRGGDEIEGRFEDVDQQGRLILAGASGVSRIDAGDVFLSGT